MASTHAMMTRSMADNEDSHSQMSLVSRSSSTSSAAKIRAIEQLETSKQALVYGHAIAAKRKEIVDKEREVAMLDAAKRKEIIDKEKEFALLDAAKRKEIIDKENELAMIDAEKTVAIAQAKVLAIDQIINDENTGETGLCSNEHTHPKNTQHTQAWVNNVPGVQETIQTHYDRNAGTTATSLESNVDQNSNVFQPAIVPALTRRLSSDLRTPTTLEAMARSHTTLEESVSATMNRRLSNHSDSALRNTAVPPSTQYFPGYSSDRTQLLDRRHKTWNNTYNDAPMPYTRADDVGHPYTRPTFGPSKPDTLVEPLYVEYAHGLSTRQVATDPASTIVEQHDPPLRPQYGSVDDQPILQRRADPTHMYTGQQHSLHELTYNPRSDLPPNGLSVKTDPPINNMPSNRERFSRPTIQSNDRATSSVRTPTAGTVCGPTSATGINNEYGPGTSSTVTPKTEYGLIHGVSPNHSKITVADSAGNSQLANILARQNLPRCEPSIFDRDVTMYFPWKSSFQMMLSNTAISPSQQLIYLRNFTKGQAANVVDSFSRRLYADPENALRDVWSALDRRFGNVAGITNAHLELLDKAARFSEHDTEKLQQFSDVCSNVDSQLSWLPGLASLNFPNVLHPIINKLPNYLRIKWEKIVSDYADKHNDAYPTFSVFCDMITSQSRQKNHPNIQVHKLTTSNHARDMSADEPRHAYYVDEQDTARVLKSTTNVSPSTKDKPKNQPTKKIKYCPIHDSPNHDLHTCYVFNTSTLEKKNEFLRQSGICPRCLVGEHDIKKCNADITCSKCQSKSHCRQLHVDASNGYRPERVRTACTEVCGGDVGGVSCSKILLLDVYAQDTPTSTRRIYALLDDQSNVSLLSPKFVDDMNLDGTQEKYSLSTCSGENVTTYGRRIHGLVVKSVVNDTEYALPSLLECDFIPSDKREVATPEMAKMFPHLCDISHEIPPYDNSAKISMLIGRDAPEMLKVRDSKNGPVGAPWAQKLLLGWTINGQVCLNRIGGPVHVKVQKTTKDHSNTPSNYGYDIKSCDNKIQVSHIIDQHNDVFQTRSDDDEVGMSQEDRRFLSIMDSGFHKTSTGNCEMPLPFRDDNVTMPNNRRQALKRLESLRRSMSRKPTMKEDYVAFMTNIFEKGHASTIPDQSAENNDAGDIWYLPHFGVYNQKKPGQIRVVFDSSAEYGGTSLNKVLLTGPDHLNSLHGVLVRFRKEDVAFSCDIEQMFHSFYVDEEHRNFLRFLWFKDNNPANEVVECRMNVHLFGNASSPAIATYGLRRTADEGNDEICGLTKQFVHRDFYVDDGLTSRATEQDALATIRDAQTLLKSSNLRLHKVASNRVNVIESLPADDRAKGIRELDLQTDTLPAIRTLGVKWNLHDDMFTFQVDIPDKPYTRRGVLSVINSVYDPLGLAAPVTLKGKLLLQQLTAMAKTGESLGWDDPLPAHAAKDWQKWTTDVGKLKDVSTPRCYHPMDFGTITRREIHGFADASKDAVGVAVYLRQVNTNGDVCVSLVHGQAKVAPSRQTTIPRLELCAAVMLTHAVQKVKTEICEQIHDTFYYTDSKIVLGYIRNESRRFYIYVSNRVQKIRNLSNATDWNYVDTTENPADMATRGIPTDELVASRWHTGPHFLWETRIVLPDVQSVDMDDAYDPDVKTLVTRATEVTRPYALGTDRFKRFSDWNIMRCAVANLIRIIRTFKYRRDYEGTPDDHIKPHEGYPTPQELLDAEKIIIANVQNDAFVEETKIIREQSEQNLKDKSQHTLKGTPLYKLNAFIDDDGTLRVGGRIRRAELSFNERHPTILPKNHHVTELIIKHYHERQQHQGRTSTLGALRTAGYWIIGGQRLVSRAIYLCVTCRRLRGKVLTQQMADLPSDRLDTTQPPFTNVGIDVFGPWVVATRKLRGGALETKRWGLVLTCLVSRAVHIEVLESLDTSAFICALRRFFAIRGTVSILRCDRGTNFVGAKNEMDECLQKMDQDSITKFLSDEGCQWIFNPPHASHFGGVWERQILTIRRVLDAMILQLGSSQLTHEILVTLLAEVSAIVNSRPLTTIPTDIDEPQPLTPMMLLTAKSRPLTQIQGEFCPQDLYARSRWRRIQYVSDQFWIRWRREYLQNLQTRSKWNTETRNLSVGDVVIVNSDDTPRYKWPLGRIVQTHESNDGKVRSVDVTFWSSDEKKTLTRPISQLVLMVPAE